MCGGRKQHDGAVLPLRRHLNPRRSRIRRRPGRRLRPRGRLPQSPRRLMRCAECQRAAESPHFGARNFPHLAGTAISRLRDQDLRFLAAAPDA
jgi:hypothetical protein